MPNAKTKDKKIQVKEVVIPCEYKVGDILYPIHKNKIMKFEVVKILPTYVFSGKYDSPDYVSTEIPVIYLAHFEWKSSEIDCFQQDDEITKKMWVSDYKEAWKLQAEKKVSDATKALEKSVSNRAWVDENIINKQD